LAAFSDADRDAPYTDPGRDEPVNLSGCPDNQDIAPELSDEERRRAAQKHRQGLGSATDVRSDTGGTSVLPAREAETEANG
jgi:hypothetical protein